MLTRLFVAAALTLAVGSAPPAQSYKSDPNNRSTEKVLNGAESTPDRKTDSGIIGGSDRSTSIPAAPGAEAPLAAPLPR